jgi:ribosomal protein S18 acetylase RimI-like enzyme
LSANLIQRFSGQERALAVDIRAVAGTDRAAIWGILEPVLRAGDSYALPADWDEAAALAFWLGGDHSVFVAEESGQVVGTYYLRPNQQGGGAHVANCGYITHQGATGRGVARAMALHSLALAAERGFLAMQFNFVVGSNARAIGLWQSLGFSTVGRLPAAFLHPQQGYIDAFVMYRSLAG